MQIPRQLSVCHTSGISSAHMGNCGQATHLLWHYQSACSTGEETRAHSSGEATWAFLTGMEQLLAESPTREGKRTASELSIWHTPSRPQAYVRGRCITGLDDMFIFVKEGIRKLSDLNMVRGNNTSFIFLRWHLVARTGSVKPELAPQTR